MAGVGGADVGRRMGPAEWALLGLLSILWGGSFFFAEVVLAELPPLTVVLGRVGLAALALNAAVRVTGHRLPRAARAWGAFLAMGALNNVVPFGLIVWGQTQIASGLAAILNATTPLFTLVLAHLLTRDEIVSDFLFLTRLDAASAVDGGRAPTMREGWSCWSAGGDVQTSLRVHDWPDLSAPHGRDFLNWMVSVPTQGTTVAVAARRNGEHVELQATVRLELPDAGAAKRAAYQVETVMDAAGARVQRLDGEQVFGLASSLPLGGFLS